MAERFALTAPLWRYQGRAAWHFLTVPSDVSFEIHERYGVMSGGFGSLRVQVTVGETSWRTSIFFEASSGSYLLPVKRQVRTAEALAAGDEVAFGLQVL